MSASGTRLPSSVFQRNVSVARGLTDAVGTPPGQIALPDADIDAAEIAPLYPNVDVAVVNGDREVEEV
jgi:hypothetical protein